MSQQRNIGGKAKSLVKLTKAGFNVPTFTVYTEHDLVKTPDGLLPKMLHDELGSQGYFAVRSSANLEDGKNHSFAGIFHTELFVAFDDIPAAIQKVQASKQSEQLDSYCQINKINIAKIELSVIIQKMIAAEVSGVAFGQDPSKPYKKSMVVSSVYGLGEGLVSGKLNADTFYSSNNSWIETIAEKEQKLIFDGAKLTYVDLSEDKRLKATLSKEQLEEIRTVLTRLEKEYGHPQDVEFCYANDALFILQSRPITTLKKYEKHTIWDNSNIIESYPGVTLPFTFSFILAIYESVYKNFGLLLGVPAKQIEANKEVFAEMLGHINGRVYYHLIHWYKALAMLPAYEINAGYMENMMGVSEPLGVDFELKAKPSKLGSYWNLTKTLIKILILNRRLPKIKTKFSKKVNTIISDYKAIDYTGVSKHEIWKDYKHFKAVLVNGWSPPLANDLLAMIYFGTLQKLCTQWLGDEQLHTELVAGKHPVKSVLPARLIQKIIQTAEEEGSLTTIHDSSESEIWSLCKKVEFGETGKLISKYIQLYGDRSVGELKLENETYTQNPESFITILKSYKTTSQNREKPNAIDEKKILDRLSFPKSNVLRYFIKKASETVSDRENLRFDRTLGFGTVRKFLWEIGKRLEADKTLLNFEDIFYLKEQELEQLLDNKTDAQEVHQIVRARKVEFDTYKAQPTPPERVHQYDDELDIEYTIEQHEGQLKGVPCCSGEVTGKVRILSDPKDIKSLEGDILVTSSTDPGWITIFQSASAILVERGSTLSHAAIVSREMGIPCIVGIKGLTQVLKNGDTVKMNGKTGIVELYEAE